MKQFENHTNKYLEELGVKPEEYNWVNNPSLTKKANKRRKKQREDYGFDYFETISLDITMVYWLYSHFRMYLDESKKIIDLDFHTYEINGKTYTQKEAVEYVINACAYYIKHACSLKEKKISKAHKKMKKAFIIISEIFQDMWW